MARRSPPRKVTYFEPVPPRLARDTIIGSTFEVGRGAAAFEPVLRIPGICCRLENPIIEPVVVDACWLEMRRHFGTRRKEGTHSAFGGIGDRMGAAHRKIAIHFKMKLDKDAIACMARTQVMHCPDARAGKDRLHDALPLLWV
jgi:hypothetical protein